MSSPSSSTPSSPISTTTTMYSESSRPTSAAGSDAGADLSDLSIKEETVNVSEEDKAKAADIKKEANAAFGRLPSLWIETYIFIDLVQLLPR